MAPTWTQLWQRILNIWRLRKLKYLDCPICGMPYQRDYIYAGRCDECHDRLEDQSRNDISTRRRVQGNFQQLLAPGLRNLQRPNT